MFQNKSAGGKSWGLLLVPQGVTEEGNPRGSAKERSLPITVVERSQERESQLGLKCADSTDSCTSSLRTFHSPTSGT